VKIDLSPMHPGNKQDLLSFIELIVKDLPEEEFLKCKFETFLPYLPSIEDSDEMSKEAITILADCFKEKGVQSEPRISRGYVKRAIESPIYIYKCSNDFDHTADNYRKALLQLRMSVVMALSDNEVAEEELASIKTMLWSIAYLSRPEKMALWVKAQYLVLSNHEIDERLRDYRKKLISQQSFIETFEELERPLALKLLTVAKDIAISDGYIEKGEVWILRKMYKALDLPTRSVEKDLIEHAKKNHVYLKNNNEEYETTTNIDDDEAMDLLGDILLDF